MGAGAVAHVKKVHGPTPIGEKILKLRVELPRSAVAKEFDVDDVRVNIEEAVERIMAAISLDDSDLCESTANQIYRTTTAAAYRVDFCLGRFGDSHARHVHVREEYGWDTSTYWYYLEAYFEGVE